MRLAFMVFVAVTLSLVSAAEARSTLAERLRKVHDMFCPTEAPCNYCTSVSTPHIAIAQTTAPWGSECRFKSHTGWQRGIVYTFYPDKPFPVNWKKK